MKSRKRRGEESSLARGVLSEHGGRKKNVEKRGQKKVNWD